MSKIYCFRHAQASINSDNYDQLSKKGEFQALQLGIYLCEKKIKFDKIYVGALRRQQHTYEIVAKQYKKNGLNILSILSIDSVIAIVFSPKDDLIKIF